jgi:spermidine synthase
VIPPKHAGAGKLWSVEYWELTRDALAPGGITVQWVPQENTRDYELIVRSFQDVFPHTTAWVGGSMLIGANEPLRLDRATFETKLADPTWSALLGRVGINSWDSFTAMFTADSETVRQTIGEGEVLTDDRPQLEYYRTLPSEGTGWDPSRVPVSGIDRLVD